MKLGILFYSCMAATVLATIPSNACTSVIVSSKATQNGKPLMFKHRDTYTLDNRIEYCHGPRFKFIGVVNSNTKGGVAWAGENETGFCIMNTASYNLDRGGIDPKKMDKEGYLMYDALGECSTVAEFETFLKNRKKPMLVDSNFGVIDAQGGAAYYEICNFGWVKFDVNDPSVAPDGYMFYTNFSRSGEEGKYHGWERFITVEQIMKTIPKDEQGKITADHNFLLNGISRSYKHKLMGLDYDEPGNIPASGTTVDQDFIPRKMTSCAVVFEGVLPGENPEHTVMWTILGYPACGVAIPLLCGTHDSVPPYMKKSGSSVNCRMCDANLQVKNEKIFPFPEDRGGKYFKVDAAIVLKEKMKGADAGIEMLFAPLFKQWTSGKLTDQEFYSLYAQQCPEYLETYLSTLQGK